MAKYLSEHDIKLAVTQLGTSSAKSRLCEFLIGLRTIQLSGTSEVGVAESVSEYKQAVNELARVAPDDDHGGLGGPFFNPFGSAAGFKSKKFPSNGPSNTMHGWETQSDSPFAINGSVRPKSIKRRHITGDQLRTFLILRDGAADRPRLVDAAVWYYRASDVASTDGADPTRSELEERFQTDIGLTDDDVAALFRLEGDDTDAEAANDVGIADDEMPRFTDSPTHPAGYLPGAASGTPMTSGAGGGAVSAVIDRRKRRIQLRAVADCHAYHGAQNKAVRDLGWHLRYR